MWLFQIKYILHVKLFTKHDLLLKDNIEQNLWELYILLRKKLVSIF